MTRRAELGIIKSGPLTHSRVWATDTIGLYDTWQAQALLTDHNLTGWANQTYFFGPPGFIDGQPPWKPLTGDWDGLT